MTKQTEGEKESFYSGLVTGMTIAGVFFIIFALAMTSIIPFFWTRKSPLCERQQNGQDEKRKT